MDIDEFEIIIKNDMELFLKDWRLRNLNDNNGYPLVLDSIADWFEQYIMFDND